MNVAFLQCHLKDEMAPEAYCLSEGFGRLWGLKSQLVTNAPGCF
jgi:hypothetical protein